MNAQPPPHDEPLGRSVGSEGAVGALVASIAGLLICAPVAIYGVVKGSEARQDAQRTGRPLDGTMRAAWIIGVVALGLWALGLVLTFLVIVLGGSGDFDYGGAATFFGAIVLSIFACMVHAAIKQRWDQDRGGAALLVVFLVLSLAVAFV